MTNSDLERRVSRLEKTLTEFSDELHLALQYVRPDAGSSLTKSRLILEKILLQVYQAELGKEPRKPLLGEMLADNQFTRRIDRRILSRMNAIRDMGNLGPHGEYVKESDAARVLDDLCEVLDWYLQVFVKPSDGLSSATTDPERTISGRKRAAVAILVAAMALLGGWALFVGIQLAMNQNHGKPRTAQTEGTKSDDDVPVPVAPPVPVEHPVPVARPAVVFELSLAPSTRPVPENGLLAGTCVTHESTRQDGTLHVTYRLPYLEQQRAGEPVMGIDFEHDTFDWEMPVLSVKILNHSGNSVMLTECVVDVVNSTLDSEPVLVIADGAFNGVMMINEGWGPVVDPVMTFKISQLNEEQDSAEQTFERHTIEVATFDTDKLVRLVKYVPEELADERSARVSGEIEYGPAGRRQKTAFHTTMTFESFPEHLVPPSQLYDLVLAAGKAPDTICLPISHNLRAGEADQFLVKVASDKSARYEISVRLRTIDGQLLPEQKVVLDLFVPRSAAKRITRIEPEPAAKDQQDMNQ